MHNEVAAGPSDLDRAYFNVGSETSSHVAAHVCSHGVAETRAVGTRMNESDTTETNCAEAWGERMRLHLATPHLLPLRPGTALEDIAHNALPAMEEARGYLAEITQDEAGLRGRPA